MITRLKLKNWRSHLDSSVEFSEGTNCFIGNMGTGKTSIMSGICFALFGTFPELKNKKLKLEDVIMKKPSRQEQAFVELEFSVNGDKWMVRREIQKGRSTAELIRNGQMIESPQPSKVTTEIERVLKIDYDLFTRAIYSEQNQLDMFLTIPKGQRMRKIDQLLAIDKFEKARATAKILVNKCSNAAKDKRQMLANMQSDDSLNRLDLMRKELKKMYDTIDEFKKHLSGTKVKKIRLRKEIETLKAQQARAVSIKEDIKTTIALIDATDADIEKIKEDLVEYAEDTTQELKRKLEDLIKETSEVQYTLGKEKENLSILGESHAKSEAKRNLLGKEKIPELKKMVEEKKKITKKIKTYAAKKIEANFRKEKKKLDKMNMKLQKNIAKISELEDSLKELKNVTSYCPICENKLSTQKKENLKAKKKKDLAKLKKDIKTIEASIKKDEAGLKKLEKSVKDLEDLKQELKSVDKSDKELKSAENELKTLEQSMRTYLSQKKMQEKAVDMLQKSVEEKKIEQEKVKQLILKRNEYEAKKDKIKQLKEKVNRLQNEKALISGFSEQILNKTENEYNSVLVYERELETKIETSNSIVSEKERLIKELEDKKSMLEGFKSEINKIEVLSNQLRLLESGLVSTQEQLRKNFVKSVNTAMQAIWDDIYPYNDFFGVRLGIEGGDYVLQLQDSTGWIAADGIASGGERSIACLVLRIAFSLILAPQLRWIVLDEPTHNLDTRAVEVLGNVLREKVTNIVEQIFLITHDPSLETAVSGYLYKLDREKGKDGYTKINKISGPN